MASKEQSPVVTGRETASSSRPTRFLYTGVALAGIWIGVAFASIFAPYFVTAGGYVQLPLTAMSAWVWGAIASGLVLLASSKSTNALRPVWQLFGIGTAAIWVVAGLVSVFVPEMVFGRDPYATRIPIAALIAPVFALVLTAFLSVYQAGSSQETA